MPDPRPSPSSPLRRVRRGNAVTVLAVLVAIVLVAAAPRLGSDPPALPDGRADAAVGDAGRAPEGAGGSGSGTGGGTGAGGGKGGPSAP
ncbi:hypothetical protein AB0L40_27280, partial [Patulibacter sp. NPDC049589]